ncbi:MAG: hypothetical protein ACP5P4_10840, partial [Steroidobacteraceae bacterium]
MRAIWRVFRKEIRETLRDRRSLFTTLVIGPLLMPALISVALSMAIRHGDAPAGRPIARAVAIVASWARYAEGRDEQGRPIALEDARRDEVMAAAQR